MLKKLRGGFLLVIGYLLSPACWWNDLLFNLPVEIKAPNTQVYKSGEIN